MSYLLNRKSRQKNYFWVATASVLGGVALLVSFCAALTPKSPAELARDFDAQAAKDPNAGRLLLTMQAEFPQDYARLRSQSIKAQQSGATLREKKTLSFEFMRKFMLDHTGDLMTAPSANLKMILDQKLLMMRTLEKEDVDMCASMLMSGTQPNATYSPAVIKAITRVTEVRLDAIVASQRVKTSRGLPTNADMELWVKAMRRAGLTDHQQQLLLEPGQISTAPKAEICSLGILVTEAQAALPSDVAERILVDSFRTEAEFLRPGTQQVFDSYSQN